MVHPVLAAKGRVNPVLATGAGGVAAKWWLGPWPGFPAAAAIDPANCVAAYRAVATVGSVWGAGPSSLAESYVNLNQPGTYNAAPGVAPTWAAATGWTFAGIQYLTTGIIPAALPGWAVLVQYKNATILANTSLVGMRDTSAPTGYFWIRFRFTSLSMWAADGGNAESERQNAPLLLAGNYAISRLIPYRNGVAEIGTIPASASSTPNWPIWIGAINNDGVPLQGLSGDILAVVIYRIELDANQMAALGTAVTGAMAQL